MKEKFDRKGMKNGYNCFGSRKSEVQILSPRPVFVRNVVEKGDCRDEAESEVGQKISSS